MADIALATIVAGVITTVLLVGVLVYKATLVMRR